MPILEAIRCGCIVLLAKNSSLTEAGGPNAFYCDENNVESVVEKLGEIEATEAEELNKRRRDWIKYAERFSYKTSANKMMKVFEKVFKEIK